MPTATRYFDRPVTNFGPLTTTFTAPSSCATQAHPNLQWYYHPRNNTAGAAGISGGQCFGVRYDDCLPSGTAFDDAFNTIYPDGYMQYFSPGLHCPSGWTTAGTVPGSGAKPTGGLHAVPSGASGIFTEDPWPFAAKSNASGFGRVAFLPQVKAFPGILEENETLAWCCPSSFTAGIDGVCISTVRPAATTDDFGVCAMMLSGQADGVVTSFDGQTFNPPLLSYPAVTGTPSTSQVTILPSGAQDAYLVSVVPVVALIHKSDDKGTGAATATATGTATGTGTSATTASATGSTTGSTTGKDGKDSGSVGRPYSSKLGLAVAALTASLLLFAA